MKEQREHYRHALVTRLGWFGGVVAVATLCLLTSMAGTGITVLDGVGVASASQLAKFCTGYTACNVLPYTTHGYNATTNKKSYWGADPGDNCTNYVAYVEGTDYGATYPGTGLGNAEAWGTDKLPAGSTVNSSPSVGAVAWWNSTAGLGSAGHVAIVESYTATSVTVSEDAYIAPGYSDGRDFDWRTYTTSGSPSLYPTAFIHFAGVKIPSTVSRPAALVNGGYSQIDVFYRDTNGDLDDDSWSDTPAGYTVHTIASGIAGNPVAIRNSGYSQIDVFYRNLNGQLADTSWSASSGKGYQTQIIANGMVGDPSAIVNSSYSEIDVFFENTSGQLEDAGWSASSGKGYQTQIIANGEVGDPSAIVNAAYSNIDVFFANTSGQLEDAGWSASSGKGYQTQVIANGATGNPSAIVNSGYSNIDVFYPGSNGALWDAGWSASSGQGYQTHEITPGIAGNPYAIVNSGYSNIDVFYPGSNGALWDAGWSAASGKGYQTQELPTG